MSMLVELFHKLNDLLGTTVGILITDIFELIIFTITSYMLFSEFNKTKRPDLKYLGTGFFLIAFGRGIISLSLLAYTLLGYSGLVIKGFIPVISHFLEILGLMIVTFGFAYPIYRKCLRKYHFFTLLKIILVFFIALISLIFWIRTLISHPQLFYDANYTGFLILEVIKIIVLLKAFHSTLYYKHIVGKYAQQIAFSFLLFTTPAIIKILNFVIYDSTSKLLDAVVNPFPFLAGLFITRVMFLKVVDKAHLRQKLSQTEQKFRIAEKLGKMKEEFVSIVSHELRTPLTSMKLYLSLLKEEQFGKLNSKQNETLDVIKGETNRLSDLIEDILSLSKLEQEKVPLKLNKINFHRLVEETIYHKMAQKKKIKVINKIPRKFEVTIDDAKFKQVIINLFSNAIKFTPEKGKIIISAKKQSDSWQFIFEDTGCGIPDDQLPKLFDKFYQVENHMTRKEGGTGLGLAIVKRIVQVHKGTIEVESAIDHGTSFIITLPFSNKA